MSYTLSEAQRIVREGTAEELRAFIRDKFEEQIYALFTSALNQYHNDDKSLSDEAAAEFWEGIHFSRILGTSTNLIRTELEGYWEAYEDLEDGFEELWEELSDAIGTE